MKTWIGFVLAMGLLLAACETASVSGPEASQEQEAAEHAQPAKSDAKEQPPATIASNVLCQDEQTIDATNFSSGELLMEICDEGPAQLTVKATPLLPSGSGAVVSGTSFAQACNKSSSGSNAIFNWTGYVVGKHYDFCGGDMSGHLAFDRTYIVTVGSSGNSGTRKDRFYARWIGGTAPDIAAIWSSDAFTDVNPPTNGNAKVIWSSSMPKKNELYHCAATVTGLDWYDTWVVNMTQGDAECQNGLNGCTLNAYPIYTQLGNPTYPSVGDDIEVVVEFTNPNCSATVYDWR